MKITTTVLLAFIVSISQAQTAQEKTNSVFFEIGGSGGIASLNYERQFYKKERTALTWRAGLSLAPVDRNNGTGIVFPLMANVLVGRNDYKFEAGLGQGITFTTKGNFFALTTAAIGYRYQPDSKNWFYKIAYTPLISYLVDFQVQHWGGVSIGYTFKNK